MRRFAAFSPREGPAPGLPRRHDDLNVVEGEGQEAEPLSNRFRGQRVWCRIGNPFIVSAARVGVAQEEDREDAALMSSTFFTVGYAFSCHYNSASALAGPGALMRRSVPSWPKRGEEAGLGATVGDGSTVGTTRPAASASVTPIRWASPVRTGWASPGPAGWPAAPRAERESIDWPCSGPSRTAAPAPPGGGGFQVGQDTQ